MPDERAEMQRRIAHHSSVFGDRHCRLTVIGDRNGLADFAQAVRGCICTDDEVALWQSGHVFDDPWPKATTRLS
ncbi:MAG: hypothetical protein AAFY25_14900 [Pseudomonadota bacterium]